jgi:hypothetical protein
MLSEVVLQSLGFDYLFEYRPRYFIIDELEKMNKKDQTSLLTLMESGILSSSSTIKKGQPSSKPGYLFHVTAQISSCHPYLQDLEIFILNHIQKRNLWKS